MMLEILVVQPTKLSVNDCDVISSMHMNVWENKDARYDDLVDNAFLIDEEDLEKFNKYKSSIFNCFGYYLKANIISKIEIPCMDRMEISSTDQLPFLIMQPLCEIFVNKYYLCDKFQYTGEEFIEWFDTVIKSIDADESTNEVVRIIKEGIIEILDNDKKFVHFELK